MPSTSAREILDSITTSCLAVHPDVLSIPVAPAGILPRYDAACAAVARAKTVDEVQEIASNAEALRAYARQARNRGPPLKNRVETKPDLPPTLAEEGSG